MLQAGPDRLFQFLNCINLGVNSQFLKRFQEFDLETVLIGDLGQVFEDVFAFFGRTGILYTLDCAIFEAINALDMVSGLHEPLQHT